VNARRSASNWKPWPNWSAKARCARSAVSNEHPWGIMQFTRLAEELGLPRIVSTQNAYNLINRTFETGTGRSLPSRADWPARLFTARLRPPDRKIPGQPERRRAPDQWPSFGQRYTKPNVACRHAAYAALAANARPDADPVGTRLRHAHAGSSAAPSSAPHRWRNSGNTAGECEQPMSERSYSAKSTPSTCATPTPPHEYASTVYRRLAEALAARKLSKNWR
jgi:hypothetical protein